MRGLGTRHRVIDNVMYNHLHGIILIERPNDTPAGSLAAIVQGFKSRSSRKIARLVGRPYTPAWQRNYHERIVRNEDELRQMEVDS